MNVLIMVSIVEVNVYCCLIVIAQRYIISNRSKTCLPNLETK